MNLLKIRASRTALGAAVLGCLWCVSFAGAQDAKDLTVKAIEIRGLKAVSEQLVRSQLEVQTDQPYNPSAVARDIRRLYSMGHFASIKADVTPSDGGRVLTYILEEKRMVDSIKIIGNSKLRAGKIRAVLSWKEGDAFAPDAYDEERKAILKLYGEKSFANTSVDISVEEVGPSRVRIVYAINEGKKARIRSVAFTGNQALSSKKLRKAMKTKKARWFLGGKFNEEKFEIDLKSIVDKYGDIGHLEAAVVGTDIAYSPNGKKMDITISTSEGAQYTVETIETANNTVYDDDEIMKIAKVHAGDVHNKGQLAKDAELIAKGYHDSGYVNAEDAPQVTLDREKKTTHVVHNFKEGDLKYVKEVTITGNAVTKDEVIRRDIMMSPGDRFDGGAKQFSEQRLENTHYFEKLRVTVHDDEADDLYTNLMVDVDEGKTGNFFFGAGYSSEEKIGGFAELRLNNFDITNWPKFSGGGQLFSARLNVGTVRNQYSISFEEPELLGYPIGLRTDFFDESYIYTHGSNYTEDTTGGQIQFIKVLSPYLKVKGGMRYSDYSFTNIGDLARFTDDWKKQLVGSQTLATVWSLERNTLDHYRDPSTGSLHELTASLAGFGVESNFYKFTHDSTWYFPLNDEKKWVLSFRTREGFMNEYGSSDSVPISERFFAGGTDTVRGYQNRDIGPKVYRYVDSHQKESIGGRLRLVNNLELKYKVNKTFRVYTFVDSGGVWQDVGDFDLGGIKCSSGVGFGVDIPRMGPIRVDYGIPLNPDQGQGHGRLHLLGGFRF